MRYSFLLPLGLLALTGCVVETPARPTTTTYVTPAPTPTYVAPSATYVTPAPPNTTVIRTP
ncbi:MAG TPA: hypothetical protein VFL55_16785 [Acetobacteraceae bacterium]|nr:hypothetical protein [Acetobacteraceae bacterium]